MNNQSMNVAKEYAENLNSIARAIAYAENNGITDRDDFESYKAAKINEVRTDYDKQDTYVTSDYAFKHCDMGLQELDEYFSSGDYETASWVDYISTSIECNVNQVILSFGGPSVRLVWGDESVALVAQANAWEEPVRRSLSPLVTNALEETHDLLFYDYEPEAATY